MQLNRRKITHEQTHILNNQGVNACVVCLMRKPGRFFELPVAENSVQRHIDAAVKAVCESAQPFNFRDAVAGVGSRAEKRAADIDGVSSVFEGFNTDVRGFTRREKFEDIVHKKRARMRAP